MGVGGAWKLEAKSKRLPASGEASAVAALVGSQDRGWAAPPPADCGALAAAGRKLRPLLRPLLPLPAAKLCLVTSVPDAPPAGTAAGPAVAGVGSAGWGGDPGPGASAPFREEF